jgi:MYXO-CTERM domain-containing protein
MRGTSSQIVRLLVWCGVFVAATPDPASACGGLHCRPDQFVPRGGKLPANLPAVAWWPGRDYSDAASGTDGGTSPVATTASDLRFECAANGGPTRGIDFDVEMGDRMGRIRLRAPLAPGDTCTLSSKVVTCDLREAIEYLIQWPTPGYDLSFLSGRATFEVGPTAPLPAALGSLRTTQAAIESLEIPEDESCSQRFESCIVRVELELADDAQPWHDAFVYETRVDGKSWQVGRSAPLPVEQGGSYVGRARDLVYTLSPRDQHRGNALANGRHTVEMRASLPGTTLAFATEPVEIDLDCGFEVGDAGARDAGGSSSDVRDAGTVEPDSAGSGEGGSAVPRAGSHSARDAGSPGLSIKKSSCAVSILSDRADSNPTSGWALVALALGYLLRRRKVAR